MGEDEVVGHRVGVFEDDLERLAGFHHQAGGVVAQLLADGLDHEGIDPQCADVLAGGGGPLRRQEAGEVVCEL